MTLRLTSSSLAGTFRKLVAVGTARLRTMLAAIAAPAPRIGSPSGGSGATTGGAGAAAGAAAGAVGALGPLFAVASGAIAGATGVVGELAAACDPFGREWLR